jgi:hypothetical protein
MYRSRVYSHRSLEFSDMFNLVWHVDWKLHCRFRRIGKLHRLGYNERRERQRGNRFLHRHSDDAYFESHAGRFRDRRHRLRGELCGYNMYSLIYAVWALRFSGMLDLRNGHTLWKLHGRVNCYSWHVYGDGYNGCRDGHDIGVVHRAFANPHFGSAIGCRWERGRRFWLELSGHHMFSVLFAVRPLQFVVMLNLCRRIEWRFHGCVRRVRNLHCHGYD